MFGKMVEWIDRQRLSMGAWAGAFIGVVLIRYLLEAFSSPEALGVIPADPSSFSHDMVFYLTAVLGLASILYRYTGHAARVGKLVIFGLPVIWLSPCLDLALSGGAGMSYLFHTPFGLLVDFLVFLTPWSVVTTGLRVEMALIIVAVGVYVWQSRGRIRSGLRAALETYVWLFILFALPSLMYLPAHFLSGGRFLDIDSSHMRDFLGRSVTTSLLTHNSLYPAYFFVSPQRSFESGFEHLAVQALYLMICGIAALSARRIWPEIFRAILGNSRPERVGFYLLFLGLGMLLAWARGLTQAFVWPDALSGVVLAVAWYCAWMYAVHVNDLADRDIDVISNAARPLAREAVSADVMRQVGYVWAALAFIGAWAVGYYPAFLILVFTACYYIYSAPPLRLKRVPLLSSALIAGAVLCTVLAGFFFLSIDKKLGAFPAPLAAGVMLIFTLGVNMRDIKDIEGDRAEGILTLPVLCGRYGRQVAGALFAAGFLLAPYALRLHYLVIPSLPAAAAAYAIALRKPYQEKWVFILYFAFIAAAVLLARQLPLCAAAPYFCPKG